MPQARIIIADADGNRADIVLDPALSIARALESALPLEGILRLWGGEAFVDCGLRLDEPEDGAVYTVCAGTAAFWPDGRALSLFCGPTPISTDKRIRTAGRVFPVGAVADADKLSAFCDGAAVVIKTEQED